MISTAQWPRQFRRLVGASAISSLGDGMSMVALPMVALRYTRDPFAIAALAASGRGAAAAAALPAGAWVDRLDRRRICVGLDLVRLASLGAFAAALWMGDGSLALLFMVAVVLGACGAAFDVAASAVVAEMVPTSELVPANARLMSAELACDEIAGRAAGGVAAVAGAFLPFAADAASFGLSALLLRGVRRGSEPAGRGPTPPWGSILAELSAGMRRVWARPGLRSLLTVTAGLAYFQAAVISLLPLYATRTLHLGAAGYGVMLGVAGAGNIAGALAARHLHARLGPARCIAMAGLVAGGSYLALAATMSPLVASVALAVETGAVALGNVALRSARQGDTPTALQGRVAAAFRTTALVALPLGALTAGLVAPVTGIRVLMAAAAILQVTLIVAVIRPMTRQWMRTRRIVSVAGSGSIGEPASTTMTSPGAA